MSSTLDALRNILEMLKNHTNDESDNCYIVFRLVNNGINQVAANIDYIEIKQLKIRTMLGALMLWFQSQANFRSLEQNDDTHIHSNHAMF